MKNINKLRKELSLLEAKTRPLNKRIKEVRNNIEEIESEIEQRISNINQQFVDQFNEAGAEYVFIEDEYSLDYRNVYSEEDGTLNVIIGQVRGCFICNQDISRSEWNKKARPILAQFGFSLKDLSK